MRKVQANTQEQIKEIAETQATHEQESHAETVSIIATEIITTEAIITTVEEYDTEKPIVESTGKPPLKKVTTQTRNITEQGTQTHATEQTEQIKSAESENTTTNLEAAASHEETAEKKGYSKAVLVLCGIGIIALLVLCGWLRKKLLQRFF